MIVQMYKHVEDWESVVARSVYSTIYMYFVFLFLQFNWLQALEKLAIHNQNPTYSLQNMIFHYIHHHSTYVYTNSSFMYTLYTIGTYMYVRLMTKSRQLDLKISTI